MNALKKGIYDLLINTTNDFKTAISSRLYYEEAPPSAVYPYCVYEFTDDSDDGDTEDVFKNFVVEFSFYDDDKSTERIGEIQEKLESVFNNSEKTLQVEGWIVVMVSRTNGVNLGRRNRATNDRSNYKIELQKVK